MIRYLRYADIDKAKWDASVDKAVNGIVFVYSWYLDEVYEQWDALIEDDYNILMHLPWRRKYGIYYIYTPYFLNQLGVFSQKPVTAAVIEEHLADIPPRFRFIDLNLHQSNSFSPASLKINKLTLQQIDLNKRYKIISRHYSENLKRNLKKAARNSLQFKLNINPKIVADEFRSEQGNNFEGFKQKDDERLHDLMKTLIHKGPGKATGVYSTKNERLAVAFFTISHRQVIYLKGAANKDDRASGAMHFLMDSFIRQKRENPLVFDFGGSSVESIARLNNSFEAKEAVYLRVQRNNLPKFVRWIKA